MMKRIKMQKLLRVNLLRTKMMILILLEGKEESRLSIMRETPRRSVPFALLMKRILLCCHVVICVCVMSALKK